MQQTHPVITRQTTMWRANHGFNITHSMGLILFGLVYGYLALVQTALLWQSAFCRAGAGHAGDLSLVVARLCFFSVPVRGIALATLLYAAGVILSLRA